LFTPSKNLVDCTTHRNFKSTNHDNLNKNVVLVNTLYLHKHNTAQKMCNNTSEDKNVRGVDYDRVFMVQRCELVITKQFNILHTHAQTL